MFSKMKNIDTAFRHIRLFTIIVIVLSFGLCAFVLYKSYRIESITQSKVYVLANGKVLEAFASERKDNIPVEAKDHINVFHHYFFTLDPDEKVINRNIAKALYLADASAKRQYENLKESNYYTNIISANISQQIAIDSIYLNTDSYPYHFKCYATQQIIRATSIVHRSLVTEGFLRNVSRSDNNPHGFLVERWLTIENNDVKTITR
ncbi:MAG: conjugative transposon protein TraK [Chryseobacterium sp.]|nr:MAG: conjugative transposon protein TraK [Chryseobacterium sp.]